MSAAVRHVPSLLVEPLALAGGALGALFGKERTGAAARVRGMILVGRRIAIGDGVRFVGTERIHLGDDVTFFGDAYVNATGARGRVEIGDGTHVDRAAVLYGQGGLHIGRKCAIAAGVTIYSQSNQFGSAPLEAIVDQPVWLAEVRIGDDVWIGARAVILPGVHVGNHAVIGAGAVVRQDVAEWQVVAGVPARVLGDRRAGTRFVGEELRWQTK